MDNTDTEFLEKFREALKNVPTVTLTRDMTSPLDVINGTARIACSRKVSEDDLLKLNEYFPVDMEISLYTASKLGVIINEHGDQVEHSARVVRYAYKLKENKC